VSVGVLTEESVESSVDTVAEPRSVIPSTRHAQNRARYVWSMVIGGGLASVLFVSVLWNFGLDPLRTTDPSGVFSNFYDIQARAFLDGHLDVPDGVLSIEAFVIDGRNYMYFPPLPALLRIPVFLVTDQLDGDLTAISILLAWMITTVLIAMLIWRVRMVLHPDEVLRRTERWCYGAFLLVAAALPWVYHEAYAWAIACSIGALFALLGLIERPGTRGALATGAWVLAAILTRTTGGWACAIAVLACAGWFALGRRGDAARRHSWKVMLAAVIPLVVGASINWAKFRHPWMFPLEDQVWTDVNEHRRQALEVNGGSLVGPQFFTTSLVNYFRPDGIRFTSIFPYITLPAGPARAYNGAFVDQAYRTGSVTAFMPGLFLVAIWGIVFVARPGVRSAVRWLRFPVLGALGISAGVMFYGYLAHRYTAEFFPVLAVAGAIGVVDLAHRLGRRSSGTRLAVGALVCVVALFGVTANLATSVHAERIATRGGSLRDYVIVQERMSELTGGALDGYLRAAEQLPASSETDELWIIGECDSLWLATGDAYDPWVVVEARETTFEITARERSEQESQRFRGDVELMTFRGASDLPVVVERLGRTTYRVALGEGRERFATRWFEAQPGTTFRVSVRADPHRNRYILNGPGFWSIPVRMSIWNDEWLAVPTAIVESPTIASDAAAEGLDVEVTKGPLPELCERLRGRL
jgi:hypothetical protein